MSIRDQKQLERAATNGMLRSVTRILAQPRDRDHMPLDLNMPLRLASVHGHLDIVKTLLDHKAVVDSSDQDATNSTALHYAALYSHVDIAQVLIEYRADINAIDQSGQSALHISARNGCLASVELLLQQDASINIDLETHNSSTALFLALAHNSHDDVIKALLTAQADPLRYRPEQPTSLHLAVANRRSGRVFELLLKCKADIEAPTQQYTPLMIACNRGYCTAVKTLIQLKAQVNAVEPTEGLTPLLMAVRATTSIDEQMEIIQYLVTNDADIRDPRPLYDATRWARSSSIGVLLIQLGVDKSQVSIVLNSKIKLLNLDTDST